MLKNPSTTTETATAASEHGESNGVRRVFQVDGLDCAEEVALLKRELADRRGIHSLDFDVIHSQMTVRYDATQASDDEIIRGAAAAGLTARVFVPEAQTDGWPDWRHQLRLILTIASGALLLAGLIADVITRHNFWGALGHDALATPGGVPWIARFFYLASIFLGMRFVAPKAWGALRRMRPDMNLLMTTAVIGAIVLNEWFEAGVVTFLFSLALLLEHWSMGRARRAISALMNLAPPVARCKCGDDSHVHERPVAEVVPGTIVIVRSGERVPLDGIVRLGVSEVDQAPITGESIPVRKQPGDDVFAGTINQSGVLEVEVTRVVGETMLARILHMVSEAQSRRAESEQWVERFAHYYTPAMMLLGLVIAVGPPLVAGAAWTTWMYNGLVVLVIACPCALVISTPVSIVSGLTAAARQGVLIKGGRFLEAAGAVKAVALDKTGTLTRGQLDVQEIIALRGMSHDDVLRIAAAVESQSNHPLARAIVGRAHKEGVDIPPSSNHQSLNGLGAEAVVEGERWWIGNDRLVSERNAHDATVDEAATRMEDEGRTVVALGNQSGVCGLISLGDRLRDESREAIDNLRRAGVRQIVMLTGDNRRTAERIASLAGIDQAVAELMPEDKVREMERLRQQHGAVAMVGDGINDAPALASATVGIAMGVIGTDAAIETADVALMSDDLRKVPWLIEHSHRTMAIIKQNIVFALGLKFLFVILTMSGLASLWLAIAADTGASLLVIFNGLRLLRR